jgi:maltooligosyltrehalose trehalohydrolase
MKAATEAPDVYVRRLPIGAEILADDVHFRVWAPRCKKVSVVFEAANGVTGKSRSVFPLAPEGHGYFSGHAAGARAGMLYRYQLDEGEQTVPDPASRFQPDGPHGASQIIDPASFEWSDRGWAGIRMAGQIIYELHIGTFTPEGTWEGATRELVELKNAGITTVEVMPVSEFPGSFGWGYDGVDLFAPTHLYGGPDDFRRFVDRAHALGLGVILDVVYNHLGPDGNYLNLFSEDYFTDRYNTEWGTAINYDGQNSGPVREFFITNAGFWIAEYHLDGLRLDATQTIYDTSTTHVIAEITERVRQAAGHRSTIVIAENESQQTKLPRPVNQGGYGVDGLWNDDFHHSARVALTGQREAYYTDYCGKPQELVSAVKWGYLYQGQYYKWQKKRRGTPSFGLKPSTFVNYIQNHDQISNTGYGTRLHELTDPGSYRAMTALLLLAPGTPMLFQGQEFGASAPFVFFADHEPKLAALVRKGRLDFLSQFRSLTSPEARARIPDPCSVETFKACKLDLSEREKHQATYRLHRDLLMLRREDPVFRAQGGGGIDGAVLGDEIFVLRFFAPGDDRLLLVNLGKDQLLEPAPEPLLAPHENMQWRVLWTSEDAAYGGRGRLPFDTEKTWQINGPAAIVLSCEICKT